MATIEMFDDTDIFNFEQNCIQNYNEEIIHDQDTNLSQRFDDSDWVSLLDIHPDVKRVVDIMSSIQLFENDVIKFPEQEYANFTSIMPIGENFDIVRYNNGVVKDAKKGSKKGTLNKAELFKTANLMKDIKENINNIDKFFAEDKKWDFITIPNFAFTNLEMRGYFLYKAIKYTIKKYKSENIEENAYELIMVSKKFLLLLKKFKNFSENLKNEISFAELELIKICKFSSISILDKFPKLSVYNNFKKILPNIKKHCLMPMTHQTEIINTILRHFDEGFLIPYSVMAGYGKTTTAVSIGKIASLMKKIQKYKDKNVRLVFTCNIESVRLEVAKLIFHSGVSFGIVSQKHWIKNKSEWYVRTHGSCTDKKPIVLITGVEFARDVIKTLENNGEDVILFLDDPTIGADNIHSSSLRTNAKLLADLPKRTILSSATFPPKKYIQCIYDRYKENNPSGNTNILPITYCDVKIGCNLFTMNKTQIHMYCESKNNIDLDRVVLSIEKDPFIKRNCGLNTLKNLNNSLIKLGFDDIESDLSSWTNDMDNLNPNRIGDKVIEQLKLFSSEGTDEEITNICKLNKSSDNLIQYDELLNFWTIIMDGFTLIATKNPEEFVRTKFEKYINMIDKTYNLDNEINTYEKKLEEYNRLLEEKNKLDENKKKKIKVLSENGKYVDKLVSEPNKTKYDNLKEPMFYFPMKFNINSELHCKNIIKNNNKNQSQECCHNYHRESFVYGNDISNDEKVKLYQMSVPKDLILLLLAGVGVCSRTITNNYYKEFVFRYASRGTLAFVVADETISFGTNYPFNRVMMTQDFVDAHSIETINQVSARGGRLNLAYYTETFVPSSVIPRFIKYIHEGKDNLLDEGKNITMQVMKEINNNTMQKLKNHCDLIEKMMEEIRQEMEKLCVLQKNETQNKNPQNEKKKKIVIDDEWDEFYYECKNKKQESKELKKQENNMNKNIQSISKTIKFNLGAKIDETENWRETMGSVKQLNFEFEQHKEQYKEQNDNIIKDLNFRENPEPKKNTYVPPCKRNK